MSHRLLSQLAHVELLTTDLDASVGFAVDALGLDVVGEDGDSVRLRCWGDFYSHSLILTAADQPGLGHAAWRTDGPEQLDEAVARIEAAGTQGEWFEASAGHGRAYRFEGPGGHANEVVLGDRARGGARRRGVAVPRPPAARGRATASACA